MRYSALAALLLGCSAGITSAQDTTPGASGQPATTGTAAGAQSGTPGGAQTGGSSASMPAQVAPGAQVHDTSGGMVGTVTAVSNGTATVDTGSNKVGVSVGSFAKDANGLVLGKTKSELDAAAAQAQPAQIAVGAAVGGPNGSSVSKVAAVAGDLVTVQTAHTKVQLPKSAFAQQNGGLVIGMTAEQLDAAAAKATGGKPG